MILWAIFSWWLVGYIGVTQVQIQVVWKFLSWQNIEDYLVNCWLFRRFSYIYDYCTTIIYTMYLLNKWLYLMQFSKKFQSKNKCFFFNLLLLIYVKFNCFILLKSPNTFVDFDFGVYSCLNCQTPNIYKSPRKNDALENLDEITKLNTIKPA